MTEEQKIISASLVVVGDARSYRATNLATFVKQFLSYEYGLSSLTCSKVRKNKPGEAEIYAINIPVGDTLEPTIHVFHRPQPYSAWAQGLDRVGKNLLGNGGESRVLRIRGRKLKGAPKRYSCDDVWSLARELWDDIIYRRDLRHLFTPKGGLARLLFDDGQKLIETPECPEDLVNVFDLWDEARTR